MCFHRIVNEVLDSRKDKLMSGYRSDIDKKYFLLWAEIMMTGMSNRALQDEIVLLVDEVVAEKG